MRKKLLREEKLWEIKKIIAIVVDDEKCDEHGSWMDGWIVAKRALFVVKLFSCHETLMCNS